MTAELRALLQAGKLEQVCPTCGIREADGSYCTACATPTGEAHWRRGEMTEAQRLARATRAPSGADGRPQGEVPPDLAESPTFGCSGRALTLGSLA